jgi:gamma-glutamylaminecyclotransferase
MTVRLFVYGTLKEGFPNHHFNTGTRLPGCYKTRLAYPLLVVRLLNEDRAPWLVDQPGQGHQVIGQVFEIAASSLPAIDALEEVGLATGYVREALELQDCAEPGHCMVAYAYLKPAQHLPQCLEWEGPFQEYTQALAEGYWLIQR